MIRKILSRVFFSLLVPSLASASESLTKMDVLLCDQESLMETAVQECAEKYPEGLSRLTSALALWRSRNSVAAAENRAFCSSELKRRNPTPEQLRAAQTQLANLKAAMLETMDSRTEQEMEKACRQLPSVLEASQPTDFGAFVPLEPSEQDGKSAFQAAISTLGTVASFEKTGEEISRRSGASVYIMRFSADVSGKDENLRVSGEITFEKSQNGWRSGDVSWDRAN